MLTLNPPEQLSTSLPFFPTTLLCGLMFWICCPQGPSHPFTQSSTQRAHPQLRIMTSDYSIPPQDFAFAFGWASLCFHQPISSACWDTPHASPGFCAYPPSLQIRVLWKITEGAFHPVAQTNARTINNISLTPSPLERLWQLMAINLWTLLLKSRSLASFWPAQ